MEGCKRKHTKKAHQNMMSYFEKKKRNTNFGDKKSGINKVETTTETEGSANTNTEVKQEEITKEMVKSAIEEALSTERRLRESTLGQVYVKEKNDPWQNPIKILLNVVTTKAENPTMKEVMEKTNAVRKTNPSWIQKRKKKKTI